MRNSFARFVASTLFFLFITTTPSLAENRIVPSVGGEYDHFGTSVAIDGDYAVVGAPGSWADEGNPGSIFIYERKGAGWIEKARLSQSPGRNWRPSDWKQFGHSVSISGDYIIVGVPGDNARRRIDSGSAYIFKREGDNWLEQAKLIAKDARGGAEFGYSVAIDGDYAIVGARLGKPKGSAYIFVRDGTTWSQQVKLTRNPGPKSHEFGFSVDIDGNYAIVGEPEHVPSGTGCAYIFVRNGESWSQQAKLSASDGKDNDHFGFSVSIDGNHAVVGAPKHSPQDPFSFEAGVGYVFQRQGAAWSQKAVIRAIEDENIDTPRYDVGSSVCISGNQIILGATGAHTSGNEPEFRGAAYLYRGAGSNWMDVRKIEPDTGDGGNFFGCAVAIDDGCPVIGAYLSGPRGVESGSAYICGEVSSRRAATPIVTVEPLEDQFFWDDEGEFELTIRHAGHEEGEGWESVNVQLTINSPPEFIEVDLDSQPFIVPPNEKQVITFEVADLIPLIRNFERDVLFGANVQIKAWMQNPPGTVVFEDEINIYRYLDAADDTHDDRSVTLAPTLRDGRDGDAIRKRELELWGVHDEAEVEFEIDPEEEFRVESDSDIATFIFDPSTGDSSKNFIEEIHLRNKKKDRDSGIMFIEGKGTPKQKIFLNKTYLINTLQKLATRQAPEFHVHSALLTDQEIDVIRQPFQAHIANQIEARMKSLLEPVMPAIEFVNNASDAKHTAVFTWPTRLNGPTGSPGPIINSPKYWKEQYPDIPKITNPTTGPYGFSGFIDDYDDLMTYLSKAEEYSRAELHFRIATAMNKITSASIEVNIDSVLEHVGTGEPLSLNESQIINAAAKTALHELAHTLGLLHTAAISGDESKKRIPPNSLEHQRIIWTGGTSSSAFVLAFNGEEIFPPLQRNAEAADVGAALRLLSTIWGRNIGVFPQGPGHFIIRFNQAFTGVDVPQITAYSLYQDGLNIEVTTINNGQVAVPIIANNGVLDKLVHSVGGISGVTDIMTGGLNDVKGELRFQPGLSLSGLKIGLHLSYEEEEIDDYVRVLEYYYRIATTGHDSMKQWDSPDHALD